MSNYVRPHRQQPTRLPHPWDSPGKNTGVGCHFLLQCMKVESESEVAQSCPTLSDPMDCSPPGSSIRGIFQAKVLEWSAIAFSGLYSYSPSKSHLALLIVVFKYVLNLSSIFNSHCLASCFGSCLHLFLLTSLMMSHHPVYSFTSWELKNISCIHLNIHSSSL